MQRPRVNVALVVCAAILGISVAWAWRQGTRAPADEVAVESVLSIYKTLDDVIPPGARVGFLAANSDPVTGSSAHYLAQYALAPRVIDTGFQGVAFAITDPDAPPSIDRDPRLAGFELVRVGDRGIRLYRRAR